MSIRCAPSQVCLLWLPHSSTATSKAALWNDLESYVDQGLLSPGFSLPTPSPHPPPPVEHFMGLFTNIDNVQVSTRHYQRNSSHLLLLNALTVLYELNLMGTPPRPRRKPQLSDDVIRAVTSQGNHSNLIGKQTFSYLLADLQAGSARVHSVDFARLLQSG